MTVLLSRRMSATIIFHIFSYCTLREFHNFMKASDNKKIKKPMLFVVLDILPSMYDGKSYVEDGTSYFYGNLVERKKELLLDTNFTLLDASAVSCHLSRVPQVTSCSSSCSIPRLFRLRLLEFKNGLNFWPRGR